MTYNSINLNVARLKIYDCGAHAEETILPHKLNILHIVFAL